MKIHNKYYDYENFLSLCLALLENLLSLATYNNNPIKYSLKLESTYHIPNVDELAENRAFKSLAKPIFKETNIKDVINVDYVKILRRLCLKRFMIFLTSY